MEPRLTANPLSHLRFSVVRTHEIVAASVHVSQGNHGVRGLFAIYQESLDFAFQFARFW